MKVCHSCGEVNPEEAGYCKRCGVAFRAARLDQEVEAEQWRAFIGSMRALRFSWTRGWWWQPADTFYLEQFKAFRTPSRPRFALTWHWPAFLMAPFLWFLYRKMYLYAFLYAVGPALSIVLTGDFSLGIVWNLMAAVSAKYLYYWHIKDHLVHIRRRTEAEQARLIKDVGGVQPYVVWVGAGLYVFLFTIVMAAALYGPPSLPSKPTKPASLGSRIEPASPSA